MPDAPSEPLEWNEENLTKVVADLYREAETNQELHGQLLANPFETLSSRIRVPDDYRGGIFAREKNLNVLMLHVPSYGATTEALPAGTTQAEPQQDFEILCTVYTQW